MGDPNYPLWDVFYLQLKCTKNITISGYLIYNILRYCGELTDLPHHVNQNCNPLYSVCTPESLFAYVLVCEYMCLCVDVSMFKFFMDVIMCVCACVLACRCTCIHLLSLFELCGIFISIFLIHNFIYTHSLLEKSCYQKPSQEMRSRRL